MPRTFNNIYKLDRELGQGGFGTVFLAREDVSNRLVAIKQLNSQDATTQAAIVHEVRMVARFNHPNVVTYHVTVHSLEAQRPEKLIEVN
jgi:serine/threonine protein kinase